MLKQWRRCSRIPINRNRITIVTYSNAVCVLGVLKQHTTQARNQSADLQCILCDCFNFSAKYTNESQPLRINRVAYYLFKIMYELVAFTDCQVKCVCDVSWSSLSSSSHNCPVNGKIKRILLWLCCRSVVGFDVVSFFFFLFMFGRSELSWRYSVAVVRIKNESDAFMHFYLISFKLKFFSLLTSTNICRRWTWVWVTHYDFSKILRIAT